MSWQSTSLAGRATGRIARLVPLFLLAVSALQLAVGVMLLWRHFSDARADSMRASFGVLFIVVAGLLFFVRWSSRYAPPQTDIKSLRVHSAGAATNETGEILEIRAVLFGTGE